MSIGERRHRVVFQTPTITLDDLGEPDKSWSTLCTSWALVQAIKGGERFAANQLQSDIDTRIVTRNRSELGGLSQGDRAKWNGHTYDIKSVIPRKQESELEILVQEHF